MGKDKSRQRKVQIDQSGKVEQTNINTVLALTNGKRRSIVLKKKDKRILEKIFAKMKKSKSYPYIVFAVLLAILIKLTDVKTKVTVDREYMGHENTIRERVLYFMHILGVKHEIAIDFGHVGKLSAAHDFAAKVGSGKVKPDKVVRLEEILKLVLNIQPVKKTEVEKRLKDT